MGGSGRTPPGLLREEYYYAVEPDGTATAFKGCPVTGRPQHQAELEG